MWCLEQWEFFQKTITGLRKINVSLHVLLNFNEFWFYGVPLRSIIPVRKYFSTVWILSKTQYKSHCFEKDSVASNKEDSKTLCSEIKSYDFTSYALGYENYGPPQLEAIYQVLLDLHLGIIVLKAHYRKLEGSLGFR